MLPQVLSEHVAGRSLLGGQRGRDHAYSHEVGERPIRIVRKHSAKHPSQWAAIEAIPPKLGCTSETLRSAAERDADLRPGLTTDERQRLKELESENRDLKRAGRGRSDVSLSRQGIPEVRYTMRRLLRAMTLTGAVRGRAR